MASNITLPYEELSYIYEGIAPPFEKATGPVFNRTPRQEHENIKYLVNAIKSIDSSLNVMTNSPAPHTSNISYMMSALVKDPVNGIIYRSIRDGNLNKVVTNTDWWEVYDQSGVIIGNVASKLSTPVISAPGSVSTYENITLTIGNPSGDVQSYEWDIVGDFELVSGSLSGSTATSIIIRRLISGTINVRVRSVGDGTMYSTSNWSNTSTISVGSAALPVPVLNIPTTAEADENIVITITNPNSNATEYEWNIIGTHNLIDGAYTGSTNNSITVKAVQSGQLEVSVRMIGDGTSYATSGWSGPDSIAIALNPLETPTVTSNTSSVTVGGNIIFTATNIDPFVQTISWDITGDYTLVSGSLTGSANTSITVTSNSSGTINARVKLIGDGISYADSQYSDSKIVNVGSSKLSTPTMLSDKNMMVEGDVVTFTAGSVDSNTSSLTWEFTGDYTVTTGNETGSIQNTISVRSDSVGTVTAKVKAVGDGSSFTDSDFSSIQSVTVESSFSAKDTSLVDTQTYGGISLTEPTTSYSAYFSFDNKTFDPSVPALIMFYSFDGIIAKVDYAPEYDGETFYITYNGNDYRGIFIENNNAGSPTILELLGANQQPKMPPASDFGIGNVLNTPNVSPNVTSVTVGDSIVYTVSGIDANAESITWEVSGVTYVLGSGALSGTLGNSITVQPSSDGTISVRVKAVGDGTVYVDSNWADSSSVNVAAGIPSYNTILYNGESGEGNSYTEPTEGSYLSFNKKTYDPSTPALIMFTSAGGVLTKTDFAGEYTGDPFIIVVNGQVYSGVFTENNNSGNPTVLTLIGSGGITPLSTPTVSGDSTATEGDSVTYTLSNLDSNASSVTWIVSGDYTLTSGNLTGSTNTSITLTTGTSGTISVSVKAIGDGTNYGDSSMSNIVNTIVSSSTPAFDTTLNNGGSLEGISYTDPFNKGPLSFNKKTYDPSVPAWIMFASIEGDLIKIDFASEYVNEPFIVEYNGTVYNGIFIENNDSGNPVVVNP